MTAKPRNTITLSPEMKGKIEGLKERPEFSGKTFSEIVRRLIEAGLRTQGVEINKGA